MLQMQKKNAFLKPSDHLMSIAVVLKLGGAKSFQEDRERFFQPALS